VSASGRTRGFGIDFGTTNSVVAAAVGRDAPKPLLSSGKPHPSVIWYGPESTVVGADAKSHFNAYADQAGHRFVRSIKRQLGREKLVETTAGHTQPAWEVAAEIFRHLRTDAGREHRHTVDEAVLSVPVAFDGRQRADIRRAAEAAGIHVTAMIHEPFAAVVGYYRSIGSNLGALPTETILVFDWGGGTLDMTLVRSEAGRLEELATGGLAEIAGDRFDEYLEKRARSSFLERRALQPEHFRPSRPTLDRFAAESERA
jgi:molecular chaperone DnaK